MVDQDGLPVRIVLSAGQASDMGAVPQLLEGLPVPATVVADRGYDCEFHAIAGTNSTARWARIPREGGHGFHGIMGAL